MYSTSSHTLLHPITHKVHESYAKLRTALPLVGRDTVIATINDAIQTGSCNTVLVTGETGLGSSSVLSVFCLKNIGFPHFYHFVGCNKGCSELPAIMNRLLAQVDAKLKFSNDDRFYYSNLSTQKKLAWLVEHLGNREKERFLITIDGLHQLANEYYDGSSYLPFHLKWLPDVIPRNVFLLVSARTGPCTANLMERGYTEVQCHPFEEPERKQSVKNILHFHLKNMDSNYEPIWRSTYCANPLYLSLLLHEIVTSGT